MVMSPMCIVESNFTKSKTTHSIRQSGIDYNRFFPALAITVHPYPISE